MGYDSITKLPMLQRMNSLRGDPVNLDGSKINIQDKELTPEKIKRAVSFSLRTTTQSDQRFANLRSYSQVDSQPPVSGQSYCI